MKYVVYGAGAVGGVIGGLLHQAGHPVTLVARGAHLTAIRAGGLPTTEVPFVESKLWAPAGLIPTAEERAVLAGASANADGSVSGDRDLTPTGGGGG